VVVMNVVGVRGEERCRRFVKNARNKMRERLDLGHKHITYSFAPFIIWSFCIIKEMGCYNNQHLNI
jgi:hypothetical protein